MTDYAIGLYEKAMPPSMSWWGKLFFAKECGFDFLEISIDETEEKLARLDWSDQEIAELLKNTRSVGMPVRSMCLSGHRKFSLGSADPRIRIRGMEIMEKAINLADSLGIRIIQLAGYDVYYEESTTESRAYFLDNLKTAVLMAARKGILLGFETMETEFMNTVEKSMRYVNRVNSPYLGVYPDSGNMTSAAIAYGSSVISDMETGRGHIIALHLKETAPGRFREVPFTKGHVDFKTVIHEAWKLGVRRFVIEMWDMGNNTWKEDIVFANKTIREILDAQSPTGHSGQEV